jgi:hypothetical protein
MASCFLARYPRRDVRRTASLRDQDGVRSALRIGGGIVPISGFASFFSAFGSMSPPRHFWIAFLGLPMVGLGVKMLNAGLS